MPKQICTNIHYQNLLKKAIFLTCWKLKKLKPQYIRLEKYRTYSGVLYFARPFFVPFTISLSPLLSSFNPPHLSSLTLHPLFLVPHLSLTSLTYIPLFGVIPHPSSLTPYSSSLPMNHHSSLLIHPSQFIPYHSSHLTHPSTLIPYHSSLPSHTSAFIPSINSLPFIPHALFLVYLIPYNLIPNA